MIAQLQPLLYTLLVIPALLLFVIVNLWLCHQIKRVWRVLTGRHSSSHGYTSYRSGRQERPLREVNGTRTPERVSRLK